MNNAEIEELKQAVVIIVVGCGGVMLCHTCLECNKCVECNRIEDYEKALDTVGKALRAKASAGAVRKS